MSVTARIGLPNRNRPPIGRMCAKPPAVSPSLSYSGNEDEWGYSSRMNRKNLSSECGSYIRCTAARGRSLWQPAAVNRMCGISCPLLNEPVSVRNGIAEEKVNPIDPLRHAASGSSASCRTKHVVWHAVWLDGGWLQLGES